MQQPRVPDYRIAGPHRHGRVFRQGAKCGMRRIRSPAQGLGVGFRRPVAQGMPPPMGTAQHAQATVSWFRVAPVMHQEELERGRGVTARIVPAVPILEPAARRRMGRFADDAPRGELGGGATQGRQRRQLRAMRMREDAVQAARGFLVRKARRSCAANSSAGTCRARTSIRDDRMLVRQHAVAVFCQGPALACTLSLPCAAADRGVLTKAAFYPTVGTHCIRLAYGEGALRPGRPARTGGSRCESGTVPQR